MKLFLKIGLVLLMLGVIAVILLWWLAQKDVPANIQYGVSFNTPYAEELGLDWQETYDAVLDDLGVRHLRLAAHWPMVEPVDGEYNFIELDYQLDKAESVGADVIMAVGRRLPRWPECHVPDWAKEKSWEEQKSEIREYLEVVIDRYKERESIIYWQIVNTKNTIYLFIY